MSHDPERSPGTLPTINLTPVADWLGLGAFVRGANPELDAYVDEVADKLTDRVRYQLAVSEPCSDGTAEELRGHIRGLVDDFTHPDDITDTPEEDDVMALLERFYDVGGRGIHRLILLVGDCRKDARMLLSHPDILKFAVEPIWPEDVSTDRRVNRRVFWLVFSILDGALRHIPEQRSSGD